MKLLIFLISISSLASLRAQSQILFQGGAEFESISTSSKPVYLDFYTDWCAPCKRMDKEVFADSVVAHFYNEHFVSFKINAESVVGKTIAKTYHVHVYPTSIFLNENLDIISRHEGYMNRDSFLQRGETVLRNKIPIPYENLDIDLLFLEITRLEELGLDNTLLVSEFFNSLPEEDYKKEEYLNLLFSKIVFLDSYNKGYIHFIDYLDLYRRDTVRSETLLFPSDITLRNSSVGKYDVKLFSALSRALDLTLKLAEENENFSLFDNMLAAKQCLFEKIFKKQFSITQYRGVSKRRLQFYLTLSFTDSTKTMVHEFKDLLLTGETPESIIARNKEIYREAKEKVLRNNPNLKISEKEEEMLNSYLNTYLEDLLLLITSMEKINASPTIIKEVKLFEEALVKLSLKPHTMP